MRNAHRRRRRPHPLPRSQQTRRSRRRGRERPTPAARHRARHRSQRRVPNRAQRLPRPPHPLTRIAEAAEAKAAALRDANDAGLIAAPHHVSPDWRPPRELQRDSPRLPVIAWQLLDRAFDQLTATLDDPDSDLHTCASAYDQLGKAAREVAKQLPQRRRTTRTKQRTRPLLILRQTRPRHVPQDHHRTNQRNLQRMRRPLRRGPRRRTRRRLARTAGRLNPPQAAQPDGDESQILGQGRSWASAADVSKLARALGC